MLEPIRLRAERRDGRVYVTGLPPTLIFDEGRWEPDAFVAKLAELLDVSVEIEDDAAATRWTLAIPLGARHDAIQHDDCAECGTSWR